MDSQPKRQGRPNASRRFAVAFVLGVLLGVGGTVAGAQAFDRLTTLSGNETERLRGVVQSKHLNNGRLIFTVRTQQGTVLATITERVEDVDLLVQQGDSITLTTSRYAPFIKNPSIARVVPADRRGELEDHLRHGTPMDSTPSDTTE